MFIQRCRTCFHQTGLAPTVFGTAYIDLLNLTFKGKQHWFSFSTLSWQTIYLSCKRNPYQLYLICVCYKHWMHCCAEQSILTTTQLIYGSLEIIRNWIYQLWLLRVVVLQKLIHITQGSIFGFVNTDLLFEVHWRLWQHPSSDRWFRKHPGHYMGYQEPILSKVCCAFIQWWEIFQTESVRQSCPQLYNVCHDVPGFQWLWDTYVQMM